MPSKVKIKCHFCRKSFLVKRAYLIFNQENNYHSYCSRVCLYKSRLRGKNLTCENPKCNNKFYRSPYNISTANYCSRSCAAIVNNKKYAKWPRRYCKKCGTEFKNRESEYCSWKCGRSALYNNRGHIATKYFSKEILRTIKRLFAKTDRTPSRRELGNMSYGAIRIFGSWNNAILAANLKPNRSHNNRMYKRLIGKAEDGHQCDSLSEILIDDWLYRNGINHTRNVPYPNTNHRADWAVKNNDIFIEYFGLAKDSPRYDRSIKEKVDICRKNKIKLISIYPKDLYPTNQLNKRLAEII